MINKENFEKKLVEEHSAACHTAIHSATAAISVVAGGLAQIPLSDAVVITPIQISMITAIGKIFEIRIGEAGAKSIIASFTTAVAGRELSQLLLGWIPGAGNVINIATAVALTETLGWNAVDHFAGIKAEECYKEAERFENFTRQFEEKLEEIKKSFEDNRNESLKLINDFIKLRNECRNIYGKNLYRYSDETRGKIVALINSAEKEFFDDINNKTLSKNSSCFRKLNELKELLSGEEERWLMIRN